MVEDDLATACELPRCEKSDPLSCSPTLPVPLAVLGLELRASHLLGRYPSPLCFTNFSNRPSPVYNQAGLDGDLPIYASPIAGMMSVHHHSRFID
jgi:hypothetical protein